MSFTQYTTLDFIEVKNSLRDYLRSNSKFTDFDFEGSNLSILLDILAYNTYTTAYNMNMVANESFIDSATLRENVVSLARNVGYIPRSRRSARAVISLSVDLGSSSTALTLTLKAGLICVGNFQGSSYTFSIPSDITVPVTNGIAGFNNIEIYEGNYITKTFTKNTALEDQRFILPNEGVDTSTLKVFVKTSESNQISREYRAIDNIINVDSTSEIFLLQEVADERYELIFGDGIIGKSLSNNNFITASYITTKGSIGNNVSNFAFNGIIVDNNQNQITSGISEVTIESKSQNGDDIESIQSIKYYAPRLYSSQYRAVTNQDYESIIPSLYPNIDSIISYGGEELDPPQYGRVFIAAKPKNGSYLSSFTKRDLKNKLKSYSVAGIEPQFIDLKYLYVQVDSAIYYNPTLASNFNVLNTKINNAFLSFAEEFDVNKFGGRFKYSKLTSIFDKTDRSITSNITKIKMYRKLNCTLNANVQYELCFGNSFHVTNNLYNIRSTGFKVNTQQETVYFSDSVINSTTGTLMLIKLDVDNNPVIVNANVGTINYSTGEILTNNLIILSTSLEDNIIEVEAVPESNDVLGIRDLYLQVDTQKSSINLIEDVISSKSNTSGSIFKTTSSYSSNYLVENTYTR